MELSKCIACYSIEAQGDWDQIATMIQTNKPPQDVDINDEYVTIVDEHYPKQLKELQYPPWVLFYKGNLGLLSWPSVSIVGSRKINGYGESMTKLIASNVVNRYVLVSGLAVGIDALVHEIGLSQGKTIGVLGCGLGHVYPKCNQHLYEEIGKNHLLLSEYPSLVKPQKWYFPWRNRIIAALSKKLIVTQARCISGTMLTVNEAITLNREVYCVPYPFGESDGEGCNLLIQQGAQIIISMEDIAEI